MKLSDINGIDTANLAQAYAIDWQHDFDNQNYSYSELAEWQAFFETLGKKFKLTDDFRENGII